MTTQEITQKMFDAFNDVDGHPYKTTALTVSVRKEDKWHDDDPDTYRLIIHHYGECIRTITHNNTNRVMLEEIATVGNHHIDTLKKGK